MREREHANVSYGPVTRCYRPVTRCNSGLSAGNSGLRACNSVLRACYTLLQRATGREHAVTGLLHAVTACYRPVTACVTTCDAQTCSALLQRVTRRRALRNVRPVTLLQRLRVAGSACIAHRQRQDGREGRMPAL